MLLLDLSHSRTVVWILLNAVMELAEEVVQASCVNCFKGRYNRQCAENRFSMDWKSVALRTGGSRGEWS